MAAVGGESAGVPSKEPSAEAVKKEAQDLRAEGNRLYKSKDYPAAIKSYTAAIEKDPDQVACYTNRAAARMMVSDWEAAILDCRKAAELNPKFVKAYLRGAKSLLRLGRVSESLEMYSYALLADPMDDTVRADRATAELTRRKWDGARRQLQDGDAATALRLLADVKKEVRKNDQLDLLELECMGSTGKSEDRDKALAQSRDLLSRRGLSTSPRLLLLRAKLLYKDGNLGQAVNHLTMAMRYDPDNTRARTMLRLLRSFETKREAGNAAFKAGDTAKAVEAYSEAIDMEPDSLSYRSRLLANRAAALLKAKEYRRAAADCGVVLSLDEKEKESLKALVFKCHARRAECMVRLGEKEDLEQAVQDYHYAKEMAGDDATKAKMKNELRKARVALKKASKKDFYKILDVPRGASKAQVVKGYRTQARAWHPDRWAAASDEEKRKAASKMQDINHAFDVLKDPTKRRRHDSGLDVETGMPEDDDDIVDAEDAGRHRFRGGGGGFGGGGGMGGGMGGMSPEMLRELFGAMGGGMGGGRRRAGGGGGR